MTPPWSRKFTPEEVWRTIDAIKQHGDIWGKWAKHEHREEGFSDLAPTMLGIISRLGLTKDLNESTELISIMRRVIRHEHGLWIGGDPYFAEYLARPREPDSS